jgi:hypothetical protein
MGISDVPPLTATQATPEQVSVIESPARLEAQWTAEWETVQPPIDILGRTFAGTQLHRLQRNPNLWIFDFPHLGIQGAALNRVAALIERTTTSRDRILTEAEMVEQIARTSQGDAGRYFLGHDYRLEDLAKFFSLAHRDSVPLNAAEQDLRTLLQGLGLLESSEDGTWRATRSGQAVITLAAASSTPSPSHLSPFERLTTLRHELSHGEYFTNPRYRAYCRHFWASRRSDEQSAITRGFALLGYDPDNQELVINELQAFLWEPQAGAWLDLELHKAGSSLAQLRTAFLAGLDQAADPISELFQSEMMRHIPIEPPGDWGAVRRIRPMAKTVERRSP